MAKNPKAPRVIFGANGNSDKGMIAYNDARMPKGVTISCVQLSDNAECQLGDNIEQLDEKITGEYFHMHFCDKKTLFAFSNYLRDVAEEWNDIVGSEK